MVIPLVGVGIGLVGVITLGMVRGEELGIVGVVGTEGVRLVVVCFSSTSLEMAISLQLWPPNFPITVLIVVIAEVRTLRIRTTELGPVLPMVWVVIMEELGPC